MLKGDALEIEVYGERVKLTNNFQAALQKSGAKS